MTNRTRERLSEAELPDHERRLRSARKAAGWYLGDPVWADQIISYYTNPEASLEVLREAMGEHGLEVGDV